MRHRYEGDRCGDCPGPLRPDVVRRGAGWAEVLLLGVLSLAVVLGAGVTIWYR